LLSNSTCTATPRHCCNPAIRNGYDDVGFLCAVKRHLAQWVLPADAGARERRVDAFALGHSNGGYLAHLAAATMPRLLRAVVPISVGLHKFNSVYPQLDEGAWFQPLNFDLLVSIPPPRVSRR
jgi:poly(3-hydroxybutyrate) depolymerase